jgi:hypothetical protein
VYSCQVNGIKMVENLKSCKEELQFGAWLHTHIIPDTQEVLIRRIAVQDEARQKKLARSHLNQQVWHGDSCLSSQIYWKYRYITVQSHPRGKCRALYKI